jgi:hypothetical protein
MRSDAEGTSAGPLQGGRCSRRKLCRVPNYLLRLRQVIRVFLKQSPRSRVASLLEAIANTNKAAPGAPEWWHAFCGAYDVVAAFGLIMLLLVERSRRAPPSNLEGREDRTRTWSARSTISGQSPESIPSLLQLRDFSV